MDILWRELTSGLSHPKQFERIILRLIAAVVLGAVIGYVRETAGKTPGLRTHILVILPSK